MKTPRPSRPPFARPASAVLGSCLALASFLPTAVAQTRVDPLQLDPEPAEPTESYLESEIPMPTWASPDSPATPRWALPYQQPSPFLRPGLGTSAIGAPTLSPLDPQPNPSQIRYGPFDLWPRVAYDVSYGNGLNAGPDRNQSTWLQTLNPAFNLGIGNHWTIGYSPSIRIFTLEGFENTVNQNINLLGQTAWENWNFRFNHATAISNDPLIETATQTEQTTHSTTLGATWDHGTKGAFDFSLNQNIRLADRFSDLFSWSAQGWYDYPWKRAVRVGVGLAVGYDMMEGGSDMLNERINLRFSGPISRKISYSLGGGVEVRSYFGSDADPSLSPLVNARINYQILELTSLSMGFSHDVGTSYFADQITKNTSFQGTVTQVLGRDWSVSGSGGYRFSSYQFTSADRSVAREDNSAFGGASINWRPLPRFSTGLYYSYRSNGSDQQEFSFDSHQVGLRMSWAL